jgi:hypothetical protein
LSRVGEGTEVCLDVPEHLIYDSTSDSERDTE